MFGFESILMQVAQDTGNAALNSVVSIVVSVGVIAGIFAPILKKYGGRIASVGQMADTFSQKTAEQEENFYRFGKAATVAVPELEAQLKKYEVPLSNIQKRVTGAEEQLEFFRNKKNTPQASELTDLPRENVKVNIKKRVRIDDDSSSAI